jgi:endonuclease-3 related protein
MSSEALQTADNGETESRLREIYESLFTCYGPQHWWPGETPYEVMVGAVLTQACAWTNVEKAIYALNKAGLLSPGALRNAPPEVTAALIRPSGYYNSKARKLRALVTWLGDYCQDDIGSLEKTDTAALRSELLNIFGVGEETADSILLYACCRPVFVVDAYARRILLRLGLARECKNYAGFQSFFTERLRPDTVLFNEYHALLVRLGKEVCRKTPRCERCCLKGMCEYARRAGMY